MFPLEAGGHAPVYSRFNWLNLDWNLFFSLLSSEGHDSGQRSKVVGLVAREELADKAKPLVLIGLCKQQIC